jgi:hypothetical protein
MFLREAQQTPGYPNKGWIIADTRLTAKIKLADKSITVAAMDNEERQQRRKRALIDVGANMPKHDEIAVLTGFHQNSFLI